MPVYVPSLAALQPSPSTNAVPSGAAAGAGAGAGLTALSGRIGEGLAQRQAIDDLAGVLDKTSPQVAEILRAQSSGIPLFGTPSSGASGSASGRGGRGGDAVGFALQTIRDQQLQENRIQMAGIDNSFALQRLDRGFDYSKQLRQIDLTNQIEQEKRQEGFAIGAELREATQAAAVWERNLAASLEAEKRAATQAEKEALSDWMRILAEIQARASANMAINEHAAKLEKAAMSVDPSFMTRATPESVTEAEAYLANIGATAEDLVTMTDGAKLQRARNAYLMNKSAGTGGAIPSSMLDFLQNDGAPAGK